MSASQSSDGSGSSFSTGDASSVHSDNSNAEALNALYTQQHEDGDDLDQNDKGPMDVVSPVAQPAVQRSNNSRQYSGH